MAREIIAELRNNFGDKLFKAIINFNTKIKEAASFGQPITEYDPASKGMHDFVSLAREILEKEHAGVGKPAIESVESQLKAISKSADELLKGSSRLVGSRTSGQQRVAERSTIQEKIDNFYGTRQNQGQVDFAVLYPKAEQVCLAGDFNGWQPDQSQLQSNGRQGRWSISMPLQSGRYRYRYVVDGRWQQDPYNNNVESNEFGEFNSVVEVK